MKGIIGSGNCHYLPGKILIVAHMAKRRNRGAPRRGANTLGARRTAQAATNFTMGNMRAFSTRVKSQEVIMALTHQEYIRAIHLDWRGLHARGACPRLLAMMELYEKYLVHNLTFKFVPSVSVTQSGTVHVAPDYDPLDNPPTDAVVGLSSMFKYKSGAITQPLTVDMPNPKTGTEYYKGALYTNPSGPERWCSYGQLLFYSESASLSVGDSIGTLVMEYDITMMGPQVQQMPIADTDSPITRLRTVDTTASLFNKISPIFNSNTPAMNTLQQLDAAGSGINSSPRTKHVATLADDGGAILTNARGMTIPIGTRLFWKTPEIEFDGADTKTYHRNIEYVGALNTTSNFDESGEVYLKAGPGVDISVDNVRWFYD